MQLGVRLGSQHGAGLLQPCQIPAVALSPVHQVLQVEAFLIQLGGALVVVPHLQEQAVDLCITLFDPTEFVEHSSSDFKLGAGENSRPGPRLRPEGGPRRHSNNAADRRVG